MYYYRLLLLCVGGMISVSAAFLCRWYDKCFSLIVEPNGEAAVNFEHSWGDGVAVMSYFNAIFNDSNTNPAASSNDLKTDCPPVTKLGESVSRAEL